MKAELRIKPHSVLPDETVVEIWWGGLFIGQVTGADGPGIRVISKHPKEAKIVDVIGMVTEVRIDVTKELKLKWTIAGEKTDDTKTKEI